MSKDAELLSEDEIQALSESATSNSLNEGGPQSLGAVNHYDFHQPAHILKARLPALDMINETFSKYYQASLFSLLHRVVEIESHEVQLIKYSDYINALPLSTNINKIKINQLHGSALISIDPSIIYIIIDCFFGGSGSLNNFDENKELTPTENRVIEKALNYAFSDLYKSWLPISKLNFEYQGSETRTQVVNFADSSDVMVLSKFEITLNDTKGDFNILIPYSILEPLRPILASGVRKEKIESDDSWHVRLENSMNNVEIELKAVFTNIELTLQELLSLNVGDFIPTNIKETTTVYASNIKLFEGKVGMSNNAAAVKLLSWSDNS